MTGFIPAHRLGFVLRNKPPLLKIWTQVVTSCLYLWYIILYTDTVLYTLICISITLQRILLNQRAHQATKLTQTSYKNVICYQDRISSAIHLVLHGPVELRQSEYLQIGCCNHWIPTAAPRAIPSLVHYVKYFYSVREIFHNCLICLFHCWKISIWCNSRLLTVGGREGEGRYNLMLLLWRRLHTSAPLSRLVPAWSKGRRILSLSEVEKSLVQLCSGNLKWSCWWWQAAVSGPPRLWNRGQQIHTLLAEEWCILGWQ